VQRWIWTFDDIASLDAQLDEAKIASGRVRDITEIAASEWAAQWGATRTVPDGAGGRITVPGLPWHFTGPVDDGGPDAVVEQTPARQGEHNEDLVRELGYSDDEIATLIKTGVLVHGRGTN
jgi:crotonobetainyl-CoA:carnitine CoA-transferase CaiB-like acyl-CoA transferase